MNNEISLLQGRFTYEQKKCNGESIIGQGVKVEINNQYTCITDTAKHHALMIETCLKELVQCPIIHIDLLIIINDHTMQRMNYEADKGTITNAIIIQRGTLIKLIITIIIMALTQSCTPKITIYRTQ